MKNKHVFVAHASRDDKYEGVGIASPRQLARPLQTWISEVISMAGDLSVRGTGVVAPLPTSCERVG